MQRTIDTVRSMEKGSLFCGIDVAFASKKMKTLTKGNPIKLILLFAVPLLIGNLFQQLYSLSDTIIVGQTLGVDALAAVGSTGSIQFLIIGFAQGLTAGLSILTAQYFGAGDYQKSSPKFRDEHRDYCHRNRAVDDF